MPPTLLFAVAFLVFLTPSMGEMSERLSADGTFKLPTSKADGLRVISPLVLELTKITTRGSNPNPTVEWNFVGRDDTLQAPPPSELVVTVEGKRIDIAAVGFKRRVLYASMKSHDLAIGNALYLQLTAPIRDGQTVEVTNPDAKLWAPSERYAVTMEPLRYSPAIHVNQEGYVPAFPKKAMVGYYTGSLGELDLVTGTGFRIISARTGTTSFEGHLTRRPDVGYRYTPLPYQSVLQADFSELKTPGEYYLSVPGLGVSMPFLIDEGIAMGWMRTYALGLYFQRCGTSVGPPFSRFAHDACHTAPAEVPVPESAYPFTWTTIASKNGDYSDNPRHTAKQLKGETSQLYPFVRRGLVDVSGGHHDAGDYSKYTINSAALVHYLMFTADAIPGAGELDNLGLPESGNGIGDLMEEAKWEADYLTKLQDTDGGFYFLVYPKTHEYEGDVSLTDGDDGAVQVVWPKNTSATAAAVAALAQCASSPQFKRHYPISAERYLRQAKLGWNFLMAAISRYGKDGAYQKITFYGDNFGHDDELAWAACEMYLATGDSQYQEKLFEFFPDPTDPKTFRWGWWRMSESWGNAIRSYAFAVRTGRLKANQVDRFYLEKCNEQIVAAGDDALRWSNQNSYATSFPENTKHVRSAGWYFSLDQASDMAVAYQIDPKPAYIDALIGNLNYEGGTNPVNVTFITGLGQKRQQEIVSQYARNHDRVLPPDGIPLGNIQASFDYLALYRTELSSLSFPSDGAPIAPYAPYDRWADAWNVTTEFVSVNQARSLLALSILVNQTAAKTNPWVSGLAKIITPTTVVAIGESVRLGIKIAGLDPSGARIVWEGRDQQPAFGLTYTIKPSNNGTQWVEAEAEWPDGRRIIAIGTFTADSPTVNWINGAIPSGGVANGDNGDAWNWVKGDDSSQFTSAVHRSNLAEGAHSHGFDRATATLSLAAHDTLFAYVYLDPVESPTEVMLTWNDGSAEHRAYWGANMITWGADGTAGRHYSGSLPTSGKWVRLSVTAGAVGLAGHTVNGMGFTLFNGRASWGTAGKTSLTN